MTSSDMMRCGGAQEIMLSIRLPITRFIRAFYTNLTFYLSSISFCSTSSMRKPSTSKTLFLTQLRSFVILSVLFSPIVFYLLYLLTLSSSSISISPLLRAIPPHQALPTYSIQTYRGTLPVSHAQHPSVHIIFTCDNSEPCCDESYMPAFTSLLNQTLIPNRVSVLHSCTGQQYAHRADPFIQSIRQTISATFDQNITNYVIPHVCTAPFNSTTTTSDSNIDMEQCLLNYLADEQQNNGGFVLITTPAFVLENIAVESLWLYLFLHSSGVSAVRPLGYNVTSVYESSLKNDPLSIRTVYPNVSTHDATAVNTLPLMMKSERFQGNSSNTTDSWLAYSAVISSARILRMPLFTRIDAINSYKVVDLIPGEYNMMNLRRDRLSRKKLKPQLWNDHAFYKWSARNDNKEKYLNTLSTDDEKNGFDFWPMPFRNLQPVNQLQKGHERPKIMFIMPWIQMGGSEKCMLDIAERLVDLNWSITFILTMPFWYEDAVGEYSIKNEWISKAKYITSDVHNIINISPNEKFSKTLRYFLETRAPDYILTANARIIYEHLSFIKAIRPGVVVSDYNHMVHMDWEVNPGYGGGMPRYGATYTEYIDLHLTASDNVTNSMMSWIDNDILEESGDKVKTCYIGTDSTALITDGNEKMKMRRQMRRSMKISDSSLVVLFAGRYVEDKGIDVMIQVVKRISLNEKLSKKISFLFVGSGEQYSLLNDTLQLINGKVKMIMKPPAIGIESLRNYYAMSDIFLLPSNNEGIALVLYEAMASGLLVMSTDVGGQNELIKTDTGILLPLLNNVPASSSYIVQELQAIIKFPSMFKEVQEKGTIVARQKFTTDHFCECVISNMIRMKGVLDSKVKEKGPLDKAILEMRPVVTDVMKGERIHGMWNQKQSKRSVESQVTVGVKTYVCDSSIVRQVVGLVRSIRINYPYVRIILANDGPTHLSEIPLIKNDENTEELLLPADSGISVGRNVMVNMTTTEYFVLLDDDHVFDEDTDLEIAINGIHHYSFDIVGIRVRNLPGIEELESIGIFIPRYVGKIVKFENMEITMCVWNENNGPGVKDMRVPISVDVLHNALIARTDVLRRVPWRNKLKVNEHMTFFLDNRKNGIKIGYLPSVFVHHRARKYSACYRSVRFREDKYEGLLEYKDSYLWDGECGDDFSNQVKKHLEITKGMS